MTHREEDLTERLVAGLRAIDGVETFSIFGEDHDRAPVVSFVIDGLEPGLVSAALSAEHAIAVRDGKFCAHLLVDALLEDAGVEARSAVRVSAELRAQYRPMPDMAHDPRFRLDFGSVQSIATSRGHSTSCTCSAISLSSPLYCAARATSTCANGI